MKGAWIKKMYDAGIKEWHRTLIDRLTGKVGPVAVPRL